MGKPDESRASKDFVYEHVKALSNVIGDSPFVDSEYKSNLDLREEMSEAYQTEVLSKSIPMGGGRTKVDIDETFSGSGIAKYRYRISKDGVCRLRFESAEDTGDFEHKHVLDPRGADLRWGRKPAPRPEFPTLFSKAHSLHETDYVPDFFDDRKLSRALQRRSR